MADRAAWVSWAFRRYHAGQITLDELLAMVREHRPPPDKASPTAMLDSEPE